VRGQLLQSQEGRQSHAADGVEGRGQKGKANLPDLKSRQTRDAAYEATGHTPKVPTVAWPKVSLVEDHKRNDNAHKRAEATSYRPGRLQRLASMMTFLDEVVGLARGGLADFAHDAHDNTHNTRVPHVDRGHR
jgi:hypothetical protein